MDNEYDTGDTQEKFSDYYQFVKRLGAGSFGQVVHALDKRTSEHVAVKIISKVSVKPNKLSKLRQEAQILSSLSHPNIVKFKHVKETATRIFIVMELVKGGTLQQLLEKRRLSDEGASIAMRGILNAVDYLHSQNYMHRDLKPQNILVPNPKDLSTIKLADFGLAGQFDNRVSVSDRKCGTLIFMAPEQIQNRVYSKSIDIWSCGIILYMLCNSGRHPLHSKNDNVQSYSEKLSKLLKGDSGSEPDTTSLAANLFRQLTKPISIERYTAKQALAHPWILRNNSSIPQTHLASLKQFNDEMKTKSILTCLFLVAACKVGDGYRVRKKYQERLRSPLRVRSMSEQKEKPVPPQIDTVFARCKSLKNIYPIASVRNSKNITLLPVKNSSHSRIFLHRKMVVGIPPLPTTRTNATPKIPVQPSLFTRLKSDRDPLRRSTRPIDFQSKAGTNVLQSTQKIVRRKHRLIM